MRFSSLSSPLLILGEWQSKATNCSSPASPSGSNTEVSPVSHSLASFLDRELGAGKCQAVFQLDTP